MTHTRSLSHSLCLCSSTSTTCAALLQFTQLRTLSFVQFVRSQLVAMLAFALTHTHTRKLISQMHSAYLLFYAALSYLSHCKARAREKESGQRVHYIKSTPISLPLFMYVRLSLPLPLPLVFVNILRQRNEANESPKKLFSWQPKNEGTLPLLVCAGVRKH